MGAGQKLRPLALRPVPAAALLLPFGVGIQRRHERSCATPSR
jgi:hypothetical protein